MARRRSTTNNHGTYLRRHFAQFRHGDIAINDALAEGRVALIFEIEEERAHLVLVLLACVVTKVGEDLLLDRLCFSQDLVVGCCVTELAVENRQEMQQSTHAR